MSKKPRVRIAGLLLSADKILMVEHTKNNEVYWLLPGGGVDYGESITEALVREFEEELNIIVEPGDIICVSDAIDPGGKRHVINIIMSCTYKSGEISLGIDKRLTGYKYMSSKDIDSSVLYPDYLKKDLKEIIRGKYKSSLVYKGSLWK